MQYVIRPMGEKIRNLFPPSAITLQKGRGGAASHSMPKSFHTPLQILGAMIAALLLVTVLILSGCAAPQQGPSTYRDGVMVAPPPAPTTTYTPVGAGLPNTYESPFEPSARARTLQPQPQPTRVLPETERTRREPGLWSAERVRAISDEDSATVEPYLASLLIAAPDDAFMGDVAAASPSRWCRALVYNKLHDPALLRQIPLATAAQRECLAMKLMAQCTKEVDVKYTTLHSGWPRHTSAAHAEFAKRKTNKCPTDGSVDLAPVDALYAALLSNNQIVPPEASR